MDNVLEQLFSLATIVMCLVIWILVWAQRKIVAVAWKTAENNKIYRELLLPLGPVGTGAIIGAVVSQYPYPGDFTSVPARIFFGAVCGLASAHVYKMAKKLFARKSGEENTNSSGPNSL